MAKTSSLLLTSLCYGNVGLVYATINASLSKKRTVCFTVYEWTLNFSPMLQCQDIGLMFDFTIMPHPLSVVSLDSNGYKFSPFDLSLLWLCRTHVCATINVSLSKKGRCAALSTSGLSISLLCYNVRTSGSCSTLLFGPIRSASFCWTRMATTNYFLSVSP